jgi:hypothetical protein
MVGLILSPRPCRNQVSAVFQSGRAILAYPECLGRHSSTFDGSLPQWLKVLIDGQFAK